MPMVVYREFDEQMLESLFREHFVSLCRFAHLYVKDFESAREIVQDAFVALWEKRSAIDPGKNIPAYLSTTVRNRCLNHLRDHKKFSDRLLSLENPPADCMDYTRDRLVEAELKQHIDAAISDLPEKCREIFLLNRHDHLKYQEIADKLHISVKTVETQMSRALQHLRSRLAEFLTILLWIIINAG